MKVTVSAVFDMKDPLTRLSNERVPIKVAFAISRIIKAVDVHLTDINQFRDALFQKLGVELKMQ
jgi:hypothetical protein